MDTQDKIAAAHRYVEAFEKGDMDIIRELYAEDAVVEDPLGSEPLVGIEQIVEFYRRGFDMGAKIELTDNPRPAKAAVAFPIKVFMPEHEIESLDVFDFDDAGKVIQMKAYWGG